MQSNNIIIHSVHHSGNRVYLAAPRNYGELHQLVLQHHELKDQDFTLAYTNDKGDKISLSTDLELNEALLVARRARGMLHLVVTPASPKKAQAPEQQPPHQGCCDSLPFGPRSVETVLPFLHIGIALVESNPGLKEMLNRVLESEHVRVVQPYECDACDVEISGSRHSCAQCNFDLCSSCFAARGNVHEHELTKVGPLEAIITYLKNGGDPSVFLNAYFERGTASEGAQKPVKHNAICDVCNMRGILGVRHRCATCPDWDACSVCAPTAQHPHQLVALPTVQAYREFEAARRERASQEAREARKLRQEQKQRERKAAAAAADEKRKAAAAATATEEEKRKTAPPANSFELNLQTLEEFGFNDRAANIRVLVKHRNQLIAAIQELVR